MIYPKLVVVFGLPGSGKSFFARKLSEILQASYLNTDSIRILMQKRGDYAYSTKLNVYRRMHDICVENLSAGKNVVLDGTYFKRALRDQLLDIILPLKVDLSFIEITAEQPVLRNRLSTIRTDSDADLEIHQKLARQFEPLTEAHLKLISTNDNIEYLLDQALSYLKVNDHGSVE